MELCMPINNLYTIFVLYFSVVFWIWGTLAEELTECGNEDGSQWPFIPTSIQLSTDTETRGKNKSTSYHHKWMKFAKFPLFVCFCLYRPLISGKKGNTQIWNVSSECPPHGPAVCQVLSAKCFFQEVYYTVLKIMQTWQ